MKAQYSLDRYDLEAMAEAKAITEFRREFSLERPMMKAQAKRKVLRGRLGAKDRNGLVKVTAQ